MTTVLIVDDSAVDRRLAGGLLEKRQEWTIQYASDGQEALDQIEKEVPDAVVTDLQMPKLNGLELVEAIRDRHPLVPVILMTAHGSEDIAVQALERGAASYVPKSRLGHELPDTVEHVLAIATADRRHNELMECLTQAETSFVLENDTTTISPLVDYLQDHLARVGLCDETGRIRLGVAIEEAILNAIYHGNLEISTEQLREASADLLDPDREDPIQQRRSTAPYSERRIHVLAKLTPEEATFVVRDEGPGFDPTSLPDPSDPANLERETGRGLMLMRTFMDEVRFNDAGNEVTMVKRRET